MAINSKDIETLWQRYSAEGVGKGISVAQYFESNGVPYHTFEKWYKKKYSQSGIVDCVVSSESDGSLQVSGGGKSGLSNTDKRGDVYVSYVNIGLSNENSTALERDKDWPSKNIRDRRLKTEEIQNPPRNLDYSE